MKAGFCELDITPAVGMEQPGGYGKAYISRIHDPLKVRAAVFDDDTERVALVGVDTCALQSARAIAAVRAEIEQRCGVRPDHVMVGASHTHSGGPFFGFLPQDVEDAPALVRDLVLRHSTITDPLYYDWVVRRICTAVCEADRRKQEAVLAVASGVEDKVAFNRRFRMANGRTYSHPGKGNPDIIEPAGPIDAEVGVVAAFARDGGLLGCIVNYACHGTTFGGGVSADWICYLDATIKSATGSDAGVVFLNGACGDVTQVDNQSLREPEFGEKWSRLVGTRVGAEAMKVIVTAEKGDLGPVAAAATTLRLNRRLPSEERLTQARRIVEDGLRTGDTASTEWTFAKELLILDYLAAKEPQVLVEVQAIQIGPAVFLANPAEYFCQLGLDIKRASPFPFTYVVELANGCVGYVPIEEAFSPSGGGYETVLTSYSNLEITAGTKITDASLALARSLKPGAVAEASKVEPAGSAWGYGVLGPDV